MAVGSPAHVGTAPQARDLVRRPHIVRRLLAGVAVICVVIAFAALVAVSPTLALLAAGFALVVALAIVAPPFGLVLSILLYGFEGTVKVGLGRELPAVGVTPEALGAAVLDLAFLIGVAGIAWRDRGRTLVTIWRQSNRLTHIALGLLALWLVASVLQIPVTGDLHSALAGFRLTQAYVLALLAGAMLLATPRPGLVISALVAAFVIVAAYAAFRGVAGPTDSERVAAFLRSTTPLVPSDNGVLFRNTGSFSSAIGLASFLVPAGVFLFGLGLSVSRLRLLAWSGVAFIVVALVATYVRTSLMAIAAGAICAVALITFMSGLPRKAKIGLAVASAPVLTVLLVLGALAPNAVSGGSPEVEQRSSGVLRPLSDPSLELRLERWKGSIDVVKKHPLGTGLGTVGAATRDKQGVVPTFADNSYIKILQEQGPLGALPFVLGVFAALIAAALALRRRDKRLRAVGIASVAASLSFFLLAASSEAIEQPGKILAWLFLGMALWTAFAAPEPADRGAG